MIKHNGKSTATTVVAPSCVGCAEPLPVGARFCAFCGAVQDAEPTAEVPETTAVETVDEVAPAEPDEVGGDHLTATEAVPTVELSDPEATGEGDVKRKRGRLRLVLASLVAVIALAGGAVAMLADDGPVYDLASTLTTLSAESVAVWEDADRASTLAQLNAVGTAAAGAGESMAALREELVEVGNGDDRRAAEDAFDAHIEGFEALALLASLKPADVAAWPDVAAAIDETVGTLSSAESVLTERELVGSPTISDDVSAAGERIGVAMAAISEKLDGWAAEVDRINADKAAQKVALDDYVGKFRAQMERYAGLRMSLGELSERLRNEGGLFSTAYADLGAALSQRREVHAAMSALVPPTALVPGHTAIVSAIQDSTGAVQSALTGIEEYQWGYYYEIESTPGWQAFSRTSEQIGNAYNGGVGIWDAAVAAEEARIAGIQTPAQPAV